MRSRRAPRRRLRPPRPTARSLATIGASPRPSSAPPPRAPKPYGPPSPRPRICRLALLPARLTVAGSRPRAVRNGTPCKFIASASALACDRAIVLPPRHFAGVAPTPPRVAPAYALFSILKERLRPPGGFSSRARRSALARVGDLGGMREVGQCSSGDAG